jgi:prepilin-type N-terminal cleavage/methylation domain-containing protein
MTFANIVDGEGAALTGGAAHRAVQSGDRSLTLAAPLRSAFTLVELLVVVTIIVILLALLTPALDRAMEATRRAICKSRLHSFGLSHGQYAVDNKSRLAPGWAATGQGGSQQNAIWVNDNVVNGIVVPAPSGVVANSPSRPPYGNFRELGHVANLKYLAAPHKSLYCPDMPPNLHGGDPNSYAWPADNDLKKTGFPWVHDHYNYRTTLEPRATNAEGTAFAFRAPKLSDPGHLALHVDYFTHPTAKWSHMDGYNVSHLDGSARYVPDPRNHIRHAFDPVGYFGPQQQLVNQEMAYQSFFDRAWNWSDEP